MKWKKATAVIVLSVMITTIAMPTQANMGNYLNNLMAQMKGLQPKAYEGQSRGYFVGGSASVRWGFQNEPLVSFTPPSLKVGCSGIDIVMGGFSYLNFEHLVQKLQAILAAAPAFAFRIALKTLCEACDNVLTSLENIANAINELNVDSCAAAKAVGAWAGTELAKAVGFGMSSGSEKSWFTALSEKLKDVTAGWKDWIQNWANTYDCAVFSQGTAAYKECTSKVGQVSFLVPLMRQAFSKIEVSNFPFEAVFRARFGDVYQDANEHNKENIPKVQIDPGCYDKAADGYALIEGMVAGKYKIKNQVSNTNANCETVDAPESGLEHKVEQVLMSIKNKIKSNAQLSTDEINLVNATRVPVYRLMSLASLVDRIGGSQDILTDNFIHALKKPVALDIAWSASSTVSHVARNLLSASVGSKTGSLDETVIASMNTIINNISQEISRSDEIRNQAWQAVRDQFGDLAQRELSMQAYIYQELSKNKLLDSYVYARGLR